MISEPTGQKTSLLSGKIDRNRALFKVISINALFFVAITFLFEKYTELVSINYYLYLSALTNALLMSLTLHFSYLFIDCAIRKKANPLRFILHQYKQLFQVDIFIPAFSFLFLFLITSGLYTSLKINIPIINDFSWDTTFLELDRYLHFGFDPWIITHKIASSPYATLLINILYNLWFFIFWIFLILISFSKNKVKYHAILTFNLCWLVNGIVFAILFSSAGPCFYSNLAGGNDSFTPLMNLLTEQDELLRSKGLDFGVAALKVQDYIWQNYENGALELGAGISAFPSMHVSICTLMAITCYEINKKLGYIAWLYVVIILFGSVHLGWHYAVDGYFSILSTFLLWLVTRFFIGLRN
ncbi:phosphatase PAP2 family protein [Vibrio breoganii]|nr:phosphatase PAP2 family protein [Vibrio breoganii]PMI17901.1 hypothetical protein BCU49_13070 [Vibrio breoganii]